MYSVSENTNSEFNSYFVEDQRVVAWALYISVSVVVTNGNELLVHFVSDLSVTASGFMAHYRSIPRSSRTATASLDTVHGPRVDI